MKSTLPQTKQITDCSNNEQNNTIQLKNRDENQIITLSQAELPEQSEKNQFWVQVSQLGGSLLAKGCVSISGEHMSKIIMLSRLGDSYSSKSQEHKKSLPTVHKP